MIPRRNLLRAIKKALGQPGYAWRVFRQRLKSDLSYRFGDGRSAYPETISLFLTFQCNLRCKMCGQWGEHGSAKQYSKEKLQSHLSVEEIKALIDDVRGFQPNITLFGGEPLLYPGWDEVVRYVKAAGMRCNMISNCTLLPKHAERVVEVGVDEIIVSLDGPERIHDEIRGREGTFARLRGGLDALHEVKQKQGVRRPLINVSSVIFEENYELLDETLRTCESLHADSVTFHHLIFISQEIYERHCATFGAQFNVPESDWAGFVWEKLPQIDPEKLIAKLREVKSIPTDLDVSVYPNFTDEEIRRYYTNFDFTPSSYKPRCMSPWMVAYIFPDGSVRSCNTLCFVAGNLREHTFREIWNNERYVEFRRTLRERKHFPACIRCTEFYRF